MIPAAVLVLALATLTGAMDALKEPLDQECSPVHVGEFATCSCTVVLDPQTDIPLDSVDCSRRQLYSFPPRQLLPLFTISLDLSGNYLGDMSLVSFNWLPIHHLDFSHNAISLLNPYMIENLTSLKHLDLSHNLLTDIPEHFFAKTQHLHVLDLSFNKLKTLPPNIFESIQKITSFSISYNFAMAEWIMKTPAALQSLLTKGLTFLQLENINLTSIPSNLFSGAVDLQDLSLDNNFFDQVPILYISSLKTLNMSGSLIKEIKAGSFMGLPALKALRLDRSVELQTVHAQAFVGLDSLETLSLERCELLDELSGSVFGTENKTVTLRHLSLAWGRLQRLDASLARVFTKLTSLDLQGNRWTCDCQLQWTRDKLNLSHEDAIRFRCYWPSSLRNHMVWALPPERLSCSAAAPRSSMAVALNVTLSLALLLLLALVVFLLWRRRRGHKLELPWAIGRRKAVGTYAPIVKDVASQHTSDEPVT